MTQQSGCWGEHVLHSRGQLSCYAPTTIWADVALPLSVLQGGGGAGLRSQARARRTKALRTHSDEGRTARSSSSVWGLSRDEESHLLQVIPKGTAGPRGAEGQGHLQMPPMPARGQG